MMQTMRDSGIAWIGEIPESWDVVSIQRNFDEIKEINKNMQCVIPLQYKYGKIVRKQENNFSEQKNIYTKYLVVKANDIMINGLNLSFDFITQRVAGVEEDGIITSTYIGLRPKATVDARYATFLFKSYDDCKALHSMGRGLRSILSFNEFKKYNMLYPSLAEQKKIADFLDGKCAEIDELVQTEEKMIEELKAYKQSVITEAVTKGLDSAAPMKDSGIEWIGAIPQSWRTMPIKHCCKINLESLKDTEKDDLLINYIDISSADENGNINFVDEITFLNAPSRARRIIRKGDVIISTVRTYLKVIALIDEKYDGFICSTGFAVLTPLEKVEARFLYYNIYTDSFTSRVSYYSNGISYPAINSSVLATLHITLPSIDEQKQIADYLDEKCAKIDEMIAIRNEQIDQLKDYKKSLIYEYVTGKKEVV